MYLSVQFLSAELVPREFRFMWGDFTYNVGGSMREHGGASSRRGELFILEIFAKRLEDC